MRSTLTQGELEQARDEIVLGIGRALERLSASRFSLTRPQRYFIADQLRDTADQIDGGEATSSAGSGASANGACAPSRCTN
jgi:hypothetical protein